MGQSASHPNDEHHSNNFIKNNLFQLDEDELKELLDQRPIRAEEIRLVARSLKKKKGAFGGFYAREADSPEAQLAVKINGRSKELANLRFRMVPSKFNEPIFWEATFTLLKERLVEFNALHQLVVEAEGEDRQHQQLITTKSMESIATTVYSFPDDEVDLLDQVDLNDDDDDDQSSILQAQLALRNSQVVALRQQVKELAKEIARMQASTKKEQPPKHKGKWIMEKDSIDFMGYPQELKENMRKEKQKRLQQVKNDMKFILDTDNLEDSNGHWDCCGAAVYKHVCTRG
jgi:hypothetical protein